MVEHRYGEGDREGRINERNKKSGKYANDWQGEEDEALAVTVPPRQRMRSLIFFFFLSFFKKSVR